MKQVKFSITKRYGDTKVKWGGTALISENNTVYAPRSYSGKTTDGKQFTSHSVMEFPEVHKYLRACDKGFGGEYNLQRVDKQGIICNDIYYIWIEEYYKA